MLAHVVDNNEYTAVEQRTVRLLQQQFEWTEEARSYFSQHIAYLDPEVFGQSHKFDMSEMDSEIQRVNFLAKAEAAVERAEQLMDEAERKKDE